MVKLVPSHRYDLRMTTARRIGAPDAKNRGVLLDAAEQLMLDEGYAAVTSRRVADKAGLKHQLVHYYFRTMDDLFLALFRRRAERGLKYQSEILNSAQPLWALWKFHTESPDTGLTMEFTALANHRKDLRAEIAYYAERFRDEQIRVVTSALERYGMDPDELPPVVAITLVMGVSQLLVMEQALGVSVGHAETVELVERHLRRLEGDYQPRIEQSTPLGPSCASTTAPSTASSQ
jgi:AcrR family transcriptional regulator